MAESPYIDWVRKKVEIVHLPFPVETPLYPQIELTSVPIKTLNMLQDVNQKLKTKFEELKKELYRSTCERNVPRHVEETVQTESWKRVRTDNNLIRACITVYNKDEDLDKAHKRILKLNKQWEALMKSLKEMKDQFEA